jgi:chemotaxis protein MotB
VQNAARQTRYSLSDLMKQLHYESGEARIKQEGYQTLDQLVELVKAAPADQLIRVEGHADSMEIGPSLKSMYPTNWDLSKARATGVLRYLVEKGGIDSAKISSVGYGATRPVTSNATEDGRARNRRVEIVLYSADSVPSQPEPPAAPAAPAEAANDGSRVSSLEVPDQKTSDASVEKPRAPEAKDEDSPAPKSTAVPEIPSTDATSIPAPAEKVVQP